MEQFSKSESEEGGEEVLLLAGWLAGWLTDARKLPSWRNEGAGEERKADFD